MLFTYNGFVLLIYYFYAFIYDVMNFVHDFVHWTHAYNSSTGMDDYCDWHAVTWKSNQAGCLAGGWLVDGWWVAGGWLVGGRVDG